ncbi:MAG: hypothetical protein U5O39_06285 [Gammaproteobacteria bacterium]|nr:hypothetical protein [Gammaproteobacteria bacterium]
MKKVLAVAFLLGIFSTAAHAVDMGSIVKAQVVLGQIEQVVDQYREVQALLDDGRVELELAKPIEGSGGKFVLPFDDAGNLTPWAEKALSAKVGSRVGEEVGNKAAGAIASKVPFGGFMAKAAKNKAKETGAVIAIGGWDYIKETSAMSFDDLEDYSVYLHHEFNGLPGYEEALAAAMAVYPELEKRHDRYVKRAYRDARKQARKLDYL